MQLLERVLVPRGYEVEEPKPAKIERLPGPFVPPNLQRESENSSDSLKAIGLAQFQLTRLNIKVLVDTSYRRGREFVEEATAFIVNGSFRGM